jgi:hypothetical protein
MIVRGGAQLGCRRKARLLAAFPTSTKGFASFDGFVTIHNDLSASSTSFCKNAGRFSTQ